MKAAVDGRWKANRLAAALGVPAHRLDVRAERGDGGAGELDMGWTDMPFDMPNLRAENGPADGARAHRLVPRGREHLSRVSPCTPSPTSWRTRPDATPLEYLLDLLGPARIIESESAGVRELRAELTRHIRSIRPPASCRRSWPRRKPAGAERKPGQRLRNGHRRPPQLPDLRRHRGGGRVDARARSRFRASTRSSMPALIVNPESRATQFEGAAVFGTSLALFSEITANGGVIEQSNFHDYRCRPHEHGAVPRSTSTSSKATRRRPASASRACRRSLRRSATRSSRPPANESASCR